MKNFINKNKFNLKAIALLIVAFGFSLYEGFGNVLYTNWWRQNIHWFTPIFPIILILLAIKNKEDIFIFTLNLIIVLIHYGFLLFLLAIAIGGAAVLKMP